MEDKNVGVMRPRALMYGRGRRHSEPREVPPFLRLVCWAVKVGGSISSVEADANSLLLKGVRA